MLWLYILQSGFYQFPNRSATMLFHRRLLPGALTQELDPPLDDIAFLS